MTSTLPVLVRADGLCKSYPVHEQAAGLRGALASLVRRRHGTRVAVDGISFAIGAGERVGLLGRNGAGKTTTLKMLSGLLRPTAGELEVLGGRPADRRFAFLRRLSVVLGQKSMLWWDVPAMDSFLVHKEMYALAPAEFRTSLDELTSMLEVGDLLHTPVRTLSLGQRMRCELVLALLHRPDLLLLDEPSIGLDVVAKATVREFLVRINAERGTTILLTSHDMDDVEAVCRRVLLIDRGRLGYDGSLPELVRSVRPHKRVRITYAEPVRPPDPLPDGVQQASDEPGEPSREVVLDAERSALPGLLALAPGWGPLVDLDVGDPDVDEIMRGLLTSPIPPAPPAAEVER